MNLSTAKVAILLPCYNESITIAKVVADFKHELPHADIWVYDNNSSDGSADLAVKAGAFVRYITQQGKGHVVRRMFQEIDADVYVMVDADDTYPANEVHALIQPILEGKADMVNGDRLSSTYMTENKRPFHNFGNTLVCTLIRCLFDRKVSDVMTGYRAFNRMFVKACPVLARGFEIETEMTLHTLDKRMNLVEVPISYRDRPEGSVSKLNTFKDGFRVLKTIFNMFRHYRPLAFFATVAMAFVVLAAILFAPILVTYLQMGIVPRYPTLIVSGFLTLAGMLCLACGFVLDACKKYADQMFEIMISHEMGLEKNRKTTN